MYLSVYFHLRPGLTDIVDSLATDFDALAATGVGFLCSDDEVPICFPNYYRKNLHDKFF